MTMFCWKINLLTLLLFLVGSLLLTHARGDTLIGHIIPHSHQDVGWIFRINTTVPIADAVYSQSVQALYKHPERRFIAVEQAFFKVWWETSATEDEKSMCRAVVKSGQLEFVIGGWVMSDESSTSYVANLNQLSIGADFVQRTFNVTPRYGWQIDPFGASTNVHDQFSACGFDATVLSHMNSVEKNTLRNTANLEFIWRPTPLGEIFTHVLYSSYHTPAHGLDWPFAWPVTKSNIKELSDGIVEAVKKRAKSYKTPNVMFPWGGDFAHFLATYGFDQFDQLVAYINARSEQYGVRMRYSTLDDYFQSVHQFAAKNKTQWMVRAGRDFLPQADVPNAKYWAGIFSSRSALKGYTRQCQATLHRTEQLHVLSLPYRAANGDSARSLPLIRNLRQMNADAQHHDAITGTSTPWVTAMYSDNMQSASNEVAQSQLDAISSLLAASDEEWDWPTLSLDAAEMHNVARNKKNGVHVVVYNSNSAPFTGFVALPSFTAPSSTLVTELASKQAVAVSVTSNAALKPGYCQVRGTCGEDLVGAPHTLYANVSVPAFGWNVYIVTGSADGARRAAPEREETLNTRRQEAIGGGSLGGLIENDYYKLEFSTSTGLLTSIENKKKNMRIDASQNVLEYYSEYKASVTDGAYILKTRNNATNLPIATPARTEIVSTDHVVEFRQVWVDLCEPEVVLDFATCGVSQVWRLYRSNGVQDRRIELISNIGPLAINVDFIIRFDTSLPTVDVYTDDNCFEVFKRPFLDVGMKLNETSDPIAGRFYPGTSLGFLRDAASNRQLSLIFDRTHAVASLKKGSIEAIMHRRILSLNGEGALDLDDMDSLQNVRTFITLDDIETSESERSVHQYAMQYAPSFFFESHGGGQVKRPQWSALGDALPTDVQLVSLEQFDSDNDWLVLRLAHVNQAGVAHVIDPSKLLAPIGVLAEINEVSLNTVVPGYRPQRLQWSEQARRQSLSPPQVDVHHVNIRPYDERTFKIWFK